MVAPQLATVDVTLNAFYGPNAQLYHQVPPKHKTKSPKARHHRQSQYHLFSTKTPGPVANTSESYRCFLVSKDLINIST